MPEVIRDLERQGHNTAFIANQETVDAAYREFAGRGVSGAQAELDRIDGVLDNVVAHMGPEGELTNVTVLDGEQPDDKAVALVELQSRKNGVLHARDEAQRLIDARDDDRDAGESLRASTPQYHGISDRELEEVIDRAIEARMQEHQEQGRREVDLYEQLHLAAAEIEGIERERLSTSQILRAGVEFSFRGQGEQQRVFSDAFLAQVFPHLRQMGGLRLGQRYAALGGLQMADGDFGRGQYSPFTPRDPGWVPMPSRPPQIIDYIPAVESLGDSVRYMLQTTRSNEAAAVAEFAAVSGSNIGATEQTKVLQDVGHFFHVSDRLWEDEPEADNMINVEGPGMVRESLDAQVMQGNGTDPNFDGILNMGFEAGETEADGTKIRAQELSFDISAGKFQKGDTDDKGQLLIQELYEANLIQLGKYGRCTPNLAVLAHEFQAYLFSRKGDSQFYWGPPSGQWRPTLFGMDVVNYDSGLRGMGLTAPPTGNLTAAQKKKQFFGDYSSIAAAADGDGKPVGLLMDTNWQRLRPRMGLRMGTGRGGAEAKTRSVVIVFYIRAIFYSRRPRSICRLNIKTTA